MGAGERAKALVQMKCPRCYQGDLYLHPFTYNPSKVHKMPEVCPHCAQPTEPEPGFYYGAMYVNYGFAVGLFIFLLLGLYAFLGVSIWIVLGIYSTLILGLGPLLFQYSRVVFIYFFVYSKKEWMGGKKA